MCAAKRVRTHYKLETVARACAILQQFSDVQQSLSLGEVVERTGLERTIVFRILHTLEEEGLLRRPRVSGTFPMSTYLPRNVFALAMLLRTAIHFQKP